MFRHIKQLLARARSKRVKKSLPAIESLDARQMLSATPAASLLVPAYFYPVAGGDWDRMAAAAKSVPITAILNPDSGPGTSADPVYAAAVNELRANGGHVVAYVHTSYGTRSLSTVEAEVRKYQSFYHVDGFFIDEMATDSAHLSYYHSLYTYIKKLRSSYEVIGNPGTNTQEAYLTSPGADVLVDFEDNQPNYPAATPSTWVAKHPATHFGNIVGLATSVDTMNADLALAHQRNAGYVYVTDQDLTDYSQAYDRLPVYWDQEVATVATEDGLNVGAAFADGVQISLHHAS